MSAGSFCVAVAVGWDFVKCFTNRLPPTLLGVIVRLKPLAHKLAMPETTIAPIGYDSKIESNIVITKLDAAINWKPTS